MRASGLLALCLTATLGWSAEENPIPGNKIPIRIETSRGAITAELWPAVAPRTVETFLGLATGSRSWKDPSSDKEMTGKPFYDGLIFHRVIKGFMIQGGCPLGQGIAGPGFSFEDEINATALGLDREKVFPQGFDNQNPRFNPQCEYLFRLPQAGEPPGPGLEVLRKLADETLDKADRNDPKAVENARFLAKARLDILTLKDLYERMGYSYSDKLPSQPPLRGCLAMANSGPNTNGSQFFINLVDTPHLTGKHTVFGRVVKGMDIVDAIGEVQVGPGAKPMTPVTITSIRRIDG